MTRILLFIIILLINLNMIIFMKYMIIQEKKKRCFGLSILEAWSLKLEAWSTSWVTEVGLSLQLQVCNPKLSFSSKSHAMLFLTVIPISKSYNSLMSSCGFGFCHCRSMVFRALVIWHFVYYVLGLFNSVHHACAILHFN